MLPHLLLTQIVARTYLQLHCCLHQLLCRTLFVMCFAVLLASCDNSLGPVKLPCYLLKSLRLVSLANQIVGAQGGVKRHVPQQHNSHSAAHVQSKTSRKHCTCYSIDLGHVCSLLLFWGGLQGTCLSFMARSLQGRQTNLRCIGCHSNSNAHTHSADSTSAFEGSGYTIQLHCHIVQESLLVVWSHTTVCDACQVAFHACHVSKPELVTIEHCQLIICLVCPSCYTHVWFWTFH